VLILDLVMPGLDGIGVLEALARSHPEVRVLLMTASEQAGSLMGAFEAGAAGYLSKRATGEELRQAVITAHGGGSVITPALAEHLLKELPKSSGLEAQKKVRALLGPRELEVLRCVAQGKTDIEIGKELFISPRTVQNHLTRIREKTGLRRRSELTRWAVEHAV
jgi:two-component system NarL family response regulator